MISRRQKQKKQQGSLNSLSIAIMDHRLQWIFRYWEVIQLSKIAIIIHYRKSWHEHCRKQ